MSSGRRGFWLYLVLASTMALCLSAYFIVKAKAFAFTDVGVDTFFCFYPLQLAVTRQLHELHTFTWSFELGLGGFIGSLFDPLWLITGWLPENWQLLLRLPMFVLRVLLGGGFFYGYLRQIGFRPALAVIGGLGYAFSSYGLINAQWESMHGTEFVQLSAYLFLFEYFLRHRKPLAGVCAGIVVGIGHPMALYMLALLSGAYGTLRLVAEDSGRMSLFRAILAFVPWCTLGIALIAPLLFPALYYLFESPRVSGDHSALRAMLSLMYSLNDRWALASEITGLLGKEMLGNAADYQGWGNYFEGPGFYVGLLPLLGMAQLLGPQATRRERMLCLFGLGVILLYIVWPALRYAVYGFGHVAFRFSTLWISVLILVLGLAGLRRALISGWWRVGIALAVATICFIMLGTIVLLFDKVNYEHVIRVAAFTMLYAGVAFAAAHTRIHSAVMMAVLLPIVACELLVFAVPPVIDRRAVNSDGTSPAGRYDDGTIKALAYIRQNDKGDDFYRIEKNFNSVFLNDPLVQRYPGTKSYYFHATSVTRFVDSMGLPRITQGANYISGMAERRGVRDLLGIRYVLARNRDLDGQPGLSYVTTVDWIDIYRNDSAHGFGQFYAAIASEEEANALQQPQRDDFMLDHVLVADVAAVRTKLASLGQLATDAPSMAASAHLRKLRDDRLEGPLRTPKPQVLLLSMPYDRGWTAKLDGKVIETFRADYGLTATLISAGSHQLELDYVPPGRKLGWWSFFTALVVAGIALFGVRKTRRTERVPVVSDVVV